jgi:hypothetical protein
MTFRSAIGPDLLTKALDIPRRRRGAHAGRGQKAKASRPAQQVERRTAQRGKREDYERHDRKAPFGGAAEYLEYRDRQAVRIGGHD